MRTAGLFVVAVLLPAFAYAAVVNINTADNVLLDTLPGIGPSKAAAIIEYRTQHGPFVRIEDIQKVSGIGPVTFANLKEFITVDAPASSLKEGAGLQPTAPVPSLDKVQAVKPTSPIINTKKNIQPHEEAVPAPTAEAEPAAVGAVSWSFELFYSPWILGLLGVIVLASGAFIFI